MQPNANNNLPDNIKSRLSRVYIAHRDFTDDSGKRVEYDRLILELLIKGEPFNIEFKPEKKDIAILKFADVVDEPSMF